MLLAPPKGQKDRMRDNLVPCPLPDNHSWSPDEIVNLWLQNHETSRKRCRKAFSDYEVVSCLRPFLNECVTSQEGLSLFQHWVESVLLNAYRCAFSAGSHLSPYTEVLYVCLNAAFLPGDEQAIALASQASLPPETAAQFLDALRQWAEQYPTEYPLASLGWLIANKSRPGVVLCWDEVIPQARYLKHWKQSLGAEILLMQEDKLLLRLDAQPDKAPEDVWYTVQAYEAEDLEEGDRVRYWDNLNGRPFIFAETPVSPYVAQHIAEWSDVDEGVYSSDPLPVG